MASTYLSRTPGNNYYLKATFSFWFKRHGLGEMGLFGRKGSNNTVNLSTCHFGSTDDLLINFRDSGGTSQYYQITNRKFKDTSAWYHFHYIIEGDNSTQGDRSRLYINGVRETSFSLNNNPSSNSYQIATFLSSDGAFTVGRALRSQTGNFGNFDGSISHFHCSTGYAYEPTVFGETDATTGEWKIKTDPTFTPGTDGFTILKDGMTITDQSANSNNFSVTAGTLMKSEDNPSNVFATWNYHDNYWSNFSILNGGLEVNTPSSSDTSAPIKATLGVNSGKWYWEVKCVSINTGTWTYSTIGITSRDVKTNAQGNHLGSYTEDYVYYSYNGHILNADSGNTGDSYGATYTAGDIVGVALDLDNNKLYFSKNGSWQNSGDPTSGSTGTGAVSIVAPTVGTNATGNYFPSVGDYHYSPRYRFAANFGNGYFQTTAVSSAGTNASGNGVFEYDVPAGYTALCTKGLNS